MRTTLRCPKCNFHEIISLASIPDRVGDAGSYTKPVALGQQAKEVLWGLGTAFERTHLVQACICRRCGYMEHYIDSPETLDVSKIAGAKILVGEPDAFR